MKKFRPDIKSTLIAHRQSVENSDLRSDLRKGIRYIEQLEKELVRLSKKIPKSYRPNYGDSTQRADTQ